MNDQNEEKRLQELAEKWLNGSITPEEEKEYAAWYNKIEEGAHLDIPLASGPEDLRAQIYARIRARMKAAPPIFSLGFVWTRAVAAFLILGGSAAVYWHWAHPHPSSTTLAHQPVLAHDIKGGKNGALLTMAGGQTILLDTAVNGRLFAGGQVAITKTLNEVDVSATDQPSTPGLLNELSTPRAREEQLVLSDGTRVWLDAASSIRFPGFFGARERRVEITGQAYFEVAKDAARPFIVQVGKASIEVLGTGFNVMAYPEENTLQTTLVEGSVRFCTDKDSVLLDPGQQSLLLSNGGIKLVKDADLDLAVAWKNGVTAFHKASITTIMRQVQRWYDVQVTYEGKISERTFTGEIPRDANLSELLKLFEISKIHFSIDAEHKMLIVMP